MTNRYNRVGKTAMKQDFRKWFVAIAVCRIDAKFDTGDIEGEDVIWSAREVVANHVIMGVHTGLDGVDHSGPLPLM